MDYKKSKAPVNTVTRNIMDLCDETGNIYESVVVISKRANQISVEIKQDLNKQDRGWCIIQKEQMKNKLIVGHSPDFIEALFMRWIFEIKKRYVEIPSWIRKTNNIHSCNRIVRKIGFKKH